MFTWWIADNRTLRLPKDSLFALSEAARESPLLCPLPIPLLHIFKSNNVHIILWRFNFMPLDPEISQFYNLLHSKKKHDGAEISAWDKIETKHERNSNKDFLFKVQLKRNVKLPPFLSIEVIVIRIPDSNKSPSYEPSLNYKITAALPPPAQSQSLRQDLSQIL